MFTLSPDSPSRRRPPTKPIATPHFPLCASNLLLLLPMTHLLPLLTPWASLVAQTAKNLPANAGDQGSVRSPGAGNSRRPQESRLGNPRDRGAWWATVHRVAREPDTPERLSTQAGVLSPNTTCPSNLSFSHKSPF